MPWRRVMALGLGRLGLAPAVFWAMTPAELERAAAGRFGEALGGAGALDRAGLEALMARFPDA